MKRKINKTQKRAIKQSTFVLILNSISVLIVIGSIIMYFASIGANTRLEKAFQEKTEVISTFNEFESAVHYFSNQARTYARTGTNEYLRKYQDALESKMTSAQLIEKMQKSNLNEEQKKTIAGIATTADLLANTQKNTFDLYQNGEKEIALTTIFGPQYIEALEMMEELSNKFKTSANESFDSAINKAKALVTVMSTLAVISILLVAAAQVLVFYFVRLKLIVPVLNINKQMQEIAKGNLSAEFTLKADSSEIGTLADSIHKTKHFLKTIIDDLANCLEKIANGRFDFNVKATYIGEFDRIEKSMAIIIESMNNTLKEIENASYQVASGADQVAGGAQALSQGATEQASSIQELSATIAEITAHIKANATNAIEANQKTDLAVQGIKLADTKMDEVITAMEDIDATSQKIGKIIRTIDDIAFQTNILALNAAIEAARAGTAGRGFAVVAQEVRNLAAKSSEAARDTANLIKTSLVAVETGKEKVAETAESLSDIVVGTEQTAAIINNISTASNEQASSISQVNLGLDQISGVVQTNSATAEESSAASEELSGQAQMLQQLISQFTLKGDDFDDSNFDDNDFDETDCEQQDEQSEQPIIDQQNGDASGDTSDDTSQETIDDTNQEPVVHDLAEEDVFQQDESGKY